MAKNTENQSEAPAAEAPKAAPTEVAAVDAGGKKKGRQPGRPPRLGRKLRADDAASAAVSGYGLSRGDRAARARWLLDLRAWFLAHRAGPDATAYAGAAASPSAVPNATALAAR